jgi:hypothetical protein
MLCEIEPATKFPMKPLLDQVAARRREEEASEDASTFAFTSIGKLSKEDQDHFAGEDVETTVPDGEEEDVRGEGVSY